MRFSRPDRVRGWPLGPHLRPGVAATDLERYLGFAKHDIEIYESELEQHTRSTVRARREAVKHPRPHGRNGPTQQAPRVSSNGGLATDYCVRASAIDARGEGFERSPAVMLARIRTFDATPIQQCTGE
jgi:hypothetical protein